MVTLSPAQTARKVKALRRPKTDTQADAELLLSLIRAHQPTSEELRKLSGLRGGRFTRAMAQIRQKIYTVGGRGAFRYEPR